MPAPLDPRRLLQTLDRHGVRYLLVGGMAAVAHGWPGATADVDLLTPFGPADRRRLAAALNELGARGEGFDGTARSLATGTTWHLDTEAGPIDVLFVLEPRGTYAELVGGAVRTEAFGVVVPVLGLDDLIRTKRELGRPKDLRVVIELEQLRDDRR